MGREVLEGVRKCEESVWKAGRGWKGAGSEGLLNIWCNKSLPCPIKIKSLSTLTMRSSTPSPSSNPLLNPSNSHLLAHKLSPPTLPVIPSPSQQLLPANQSRVYSGDDDKAIPGYNFQSLFRKKSHIRLARKKQREQAQKRSSVKVEQCERETKSTLKGHWSAEENKLYHWFLEIHSRHFIIKHLRRIDKIFKSMANFISSREAEQCRSHHQKMEKKYHTFYQILTRLRMEFYSTTSPDLLKAELQQHGYKLREGSIITEQELRNGEAVKLEDHSEDNLSERSRKRSISGEEEDEKQENSLLREDYEKGLDFSIKYP